MGMLLAFVPFSGASAEVGELLLMTGLLLIVVVFLNSMCNNMKGDYPRRLGLNTGMRLGKLYGSLRACHM